MIAKMLRKLTTLTFYFRSATYVQYLACDSRQIFKRVANLICVNPFLGPDELRVLFSNIFERLLAILVRWEHALSERRIFLSSAPAQNRLERMISTSPTGIVKFVLHVVTI